MIAILIGILIYVIGLIIYQYGEVNGFKRGFELGDNVSAKRIVRISKQVLDPMVKNAGLKLYSIELENDRDCYFVNLGIDLENYKHPKGEEVNTYERT